MKNLEITQFSPYPLSNPLSVVNARMNIHLLTNLRSLSLGYGVEFITFDSLKQLAYLKKLNILYEGHLNYRNFERKFGINLEIIGHLKSLEVFELKHRCFFGTKVPLNAIQQKYSHVRFRWFLEKYDIVNDNLIYEALGYYEGELSVSDNSPEGNGRLEYQDGSRYEGEFKNGSQLGQGRMWHGSSLFYEGSVQGRAAHGKGTMYFDCGQKYEGDFVFNQRCGFGIFYYPNDDRYEGSFNNDDAEGKGIFYFSDGSRYEGDFKNDCQEGFGILYYSNGNRYEGGFVEDCRQGKGIFFYSNGDRYEGEYMNNFRVGNGVFFFANGDRCEKFYDNNSQNDNDS